MARASTFLLTVTSVILTSLTVGNAFFQKKQFYPSVVYITKSSPSMAVSSFFKEEISVLVSYFF